MNIYIYTLSSVELFDKSIVGATSFNWNVYIVGEEDEGGATYGASNSQTRRSMKIFSATINVTFQKNKNKIVIAQIASSDTRDCCSMIPEHVYSCRRFGPQTIRPVGTFSASGVYFPSMNDRN